MTQEHLQALNNLLTMLLQKTVCSKCTLNEHNSWTSLLFGPNWHTYSTCTGCMVGTQDLLQFEYFVGVLKGKLSVPLFFILYKYLFLYFIITMFKVLCTWNLEPRTQNRYFPNLVHTNTGRIWPVLFRVCTGDWEPWWIYG